MLRNALLWRFPELGSLPPPAEAVGGAVRDLLLDVIPVDVDVECEDPLGTASGLGKVITLGRGDLTVYRVVLEGRVYDFSRRTDLGRRDFTVNAIAVDLASGQVRDPFGGQEDIRRRLIRMIDAHNLQDDPLRMLRAVRIAVRFDFTIDEPTVAAIRRRAARITTVAAERVTYELHAIFSSGKFRRALRLLSDTALDEPLFGYEVDASRFHADDVTLAGAYALLVRDPRQFAKRWRWSERLLREVVTLQDLMRDANVVALFDAGEEVAKQLPPLLRAAGRDAPPIASALFATKTLLDGSEIAALTGVTPGPQLGAVKRALLEAQLSGEVRSREEAERFVRRMERISE
jgi:tRNA nucleotidyltransferase/poly(A) polymerase